MFTDFVRYALDRLPYLKKKSMCYTVHVSLVDTSFTSQYHLKDMDLRHLIINFMLLYNFKDGIYVLMFKHHE